MFDDENDHQQSVSPPATPPLAEISLAHSSAPSSPFGSRDHYYENATTIPPPLIIDSQLGSGGVFGEAAGELLSLVHNDPYSDVRHRMEELRQMDGIRHGARRSAKDNNIDHRHNHHQSTMTLQYSLQ